MDADAQLRQKVAEVSRRRFFGKSRLRLEDFEIIFDHTNKTPKAVIQDYFIRGEYAPANCNGVIVDSWLSYRSMELLAGAGEAIMPLARTVQDRVYYVTTTRRTELEATVVETFWQQTKCARKLRNIKKLKNMVLFRHHEFVLRGYAARPHLGVHIRISQRERISPERLLCGCCNSNIPTPSRPHLVPSAKCTEFDWHTCWFLFPVLDVAERIPSGRR